jgi:hypothetical protein
MSIRMDAKNYNFMSEAGMAYLHFDLCHKSHLRHEETRGIDCYRNMEKIDLDLAMKVISFYTKERRGPFSTEFTWGRQEMLVSSINTGPVDTKTKAFKLFFDHYGFQPEGAVACYAQYLERPIYKDETLAHVPLKQYATCIVWETEEMLLAGGAAVAFVAGCFLNHHGGLAAIDREAYKEALTTYSDDKLSKAWDAVKEGALSLGAAKSGDLPSAYEHMVEAGKNVWESFTTPFPDPADYAQ